VFVAAISLLGHQLVSGGQGGGKQAILFLSQILLLNLSDYSGFFIASKQM
jgi:hypothetical protein